MKNRILTKSETGSRDFIPFRFIYQSRTDLSIFIEYIIPNIKILLNI